MSAAVWAKLVLLLVEGFKSIVTFQTKEEHRARTEAIRNDPIAEWNRRYGRVPADVADPATGQPVLPAPYAKAAACYFAGRGSPSRRPGGVANVLRCRRDPLPVMECRRTDYECQLLHETAGAEPLQPPLRSTDGAAGYDLASAVTETLASGQQKLIPTGWQVAIPPGHVGLIRSRSGWAVKRNIHSRAGVIDEDYRGELQVLLHNDAAEPREVLRGNRIAQLLIIPVATPDVVEVVEFQDTTARGDNGFGSTGA